MTPTKNRTANANGNRDANTSQPFCDRVMACPDFFQSSKREIPPTKVMSAPSAAVSNAGRAASITCAKLDSGDNPGGRSRTAAGTIPNANNKGPKLPIKINHLVFIFTLHTWLTSKRASAGSRQTDLVMISNGFEVCLFPELLPGFIGNVAIQLCRYTT